MGNFRLCQSSFTFVICPSFFSFFVDVDCKKGENSSVAMPLSLSSTSHLSSYLALPVDGEGKNTFNSNSTELLLASAPKYSKIFTGEVPAFFSKEQYEVKFLAISFRISTCTETFLTSRPKR